MKRKQLSPASEIGLVGLGLMGRGIAACLIANGFRVVGYDRLPARGNHICEHIDDSLEELIRRKLLARSAARNWRERYRVVASPKEMGACSFIIESVKEDLQLKQRIFSRLESVLAPTAVIASNTSSIPISHLQEGRKHPERIIGMHWGEPAQIMRYLEIIPGRLTSPSIIEQTRQLGVACRKDPTVLNFDIRGFISNRMMYAMMREACYLVESGVADVETVDRSFQNDIGWWATLAGPFRWMDLTGIPAYAAVMEGLLPELSNSKGVPRIMRDAVSRRAQGISNRKGFYPYTAASAAEWEHAWVDFTYDVRKLVEKYEKRLNGKKA